MNFVTIFAAPKPFTNPHIAVIQRNAIEAWKHLKEVEVILIGDEAGIPEAARELGVKNVPQVERADEGVPLVSSIFQIAHSETTSPVLCYANADIILMQDMVAAARHVSEQVHDYLIVGQRWNLDLKEPLDFAGDWESRLRLDVAQRGQCFSSWGIDYFIFPRHLYSDVPDFSVGRVAWDNWMVYHARSTFGMAIDATLDVLAVHQNHDYSHLPGQKLYGTEAARINLEKAGGRKRTYNILDTNRELVHGHIRRPQMRLARWLRRLELLLINNEQKGWGWEVSLRLQRMQKQLSVKPRR